MSSQLYQFDEFQPQQSSNAELTELNNYVTCDLKLSNTTFDNLFSEFDVNANDFQYFDSSTNGINYSQVIPNVSPSYNINLHSITTNNNTQNLETVSYEVLSPNAYKSLFEQYQKPQPDIKSSSSPSNYIPTDHRESSSTNMSSYQSNQIIITRQQTTNGSPSSLPFPQLIKKPEPISVTFDQFQALINGTKDASTTNPNRLSTLLENSTIIGHNIPLKIIPQTNPIHSDELDSLTNDNTKSRTTNRNNNRTRRTVSHNAIEKRYRSSINEKIHELKEIVAARDGKIQKSGILQRTVGYIRQLQSTNQRLENENSTLKNILKQFNLTNDDFPVQSTNRKSSVKYPTSLPSTFTDDSNGETGNPVAKRQKRTKSKRGMVDSSRLVLCWFMLCVLFTNPFHYLLDRIHSSDHVDTNEIRSVISSRILQSTRDNESFTISSKELIAWMLNIAICLACLVKIFVHGESIVDESEMDEYYSYKKKADQFMNENQFDEAYVYYQKCCETLYISIDKTYFYYLTSIPWQINRLCLNLIYIGRWLTYWSGWTKSVDTRSYNLELNACFFQLWKIEYHYSRSLLNLFNLFLLTINTSINSGKKLDRNKRNEIYLLSALTLKKFNRLFSFMIPYLLKCLNPIHINDIWLLDINRLNEFVVGKNIDLFKDKSFIESIRLQYFQDILYENIKNQILFQDEQEQYFLIQNPFDQFSWWQHTLQVIQCISSHKHNINNIPSNQHIYHLIRTKQLIDERYIMIIEIIHNILHVLTDDDDQKDLRKMILLGKLGESSRMLISMIESNNKDNLDLAIKTLVLDGILSLRLRLLTNSIINNNQKIPFLDDFQRELEHYKQLNQWMKLPKQRYYLFESIFRTSSGLNPLITQTLFERAIKQSNSSIQEVSSPNLDIIAALLLFCYFSPSTVYHYRTILQQAVSKSLEINKNNDLNRLQQQCLTLIRQPYLTF